MTIRLTPEQERRIRAVLSRGAYESVDQVVEAALTAVEQRTVPGFTGHRRNSTPCSLKGSPQSNSQKMSFGVP